MGGAEIEGCRMVKHFDERLAQLLDERRRRRARACVLGAISRLRRLLPIIDRAYVVRAGARSWMCSSPPARQVQPSAPFGVAWRARCMRVGPAQSRLPVYAHARWVQPSGSGSSAPFGAARLAVRARGRASPALSLHAYVRAACCRARCFVQLDALCARAHSQKSMRTHTHTHERTRAPLSPPLSHMRTCTHSRTCAHARLHVCTSSHSFSHSHMRARTRTHTRTHTSARAHARRRAHGH